MPEQQIYSTLRGWPLVRKASHPRETRDWYSEYVASINAIDVDVAALMSGHVFTSGTGALSVVRRNANNSCEGVYGFVAGYTNDILGASAGSAAVGTNNLIEDSPGSFVSGDDIIHKNVGYSTISGRAIEINRLVNSNVSGQNIKHTHPELETQNSDNNNITGQDITIIGCIRNSAIQGNKHYFIGDSEYNNISGETIGVLGTVKHDTVHGDIHVIGRAGSITGFVRTGDTIVMTVPGAGHGIDTKFTSVSIVVVNPGGANGGTFTATVPSPTTLQWTNASGATQTATAGSFWRLNTAVSACEITGFGHHVHSSFRSIIEGGTHIVFNVDHSRISGLNQRVGSVTGNHASLDVEGEYNQVWNATLNCRVKGSRSRLLGSNNQSVDGDMNAVGLFNEGSKVSLSVSGTTVTLQDLDGFFIPFFADLVGKPITITGANNAGNNGTYAVTTVLSDTLLQFTNASAVNESGNSRLMYRFAVPGNNNKVRGNKNVLFGGAGLVQDNSIEGTGNILLNSNGGRIRGNNNLFRNGAFSTGGSIEGSNNLVENGAAAFALLGDNCHATGSFTQGLMAGFRLVANNNSKGSWVGGRYAKADRHFSSIVFAGGHPENAASDAIAGQGQVIALMTLSRTTANDTPTMLYPDGAQAANLWTTLNDNAYFVTLNVLAKCTSGDSENGVKCWKIEVLLNNVAGTLAIINQTTTILGVTSIANEGDWILVPYVHTETGQTNRFTLQVTGHANDTIRWQAQLSGPELGVL
jgi:hypothetical protein